MPASKAQRALTAQRREKAWQLKLAGATLDEIATALQYASAAAVSKDLARSLQSALNMEAKVANEYRALKYARLERLLRGHWAAAIKGDSKAAMVVLAVIDREVKLLGLDAPVKVEATVQDAETAREALAVQELVNEAKARAAAMAVHPAGGEGE
jgi:hypothetical protein